MRTVINAVKRLPTHILNPLRNFLKDSRAVGIILILCTVLSLVLANLPATSTAYTAFWQTETHFFKGILHLPENLVGWINDAFMAVFFFLVAMEIKRELAIGELSSIRKSLLPVVAAIGGMIFPAIIFALFNGGTAFSKGWGIPMATDIAFSLGVLSLLGKRVPVQLKIFLAALAIIDDLGAIITIAVFYAGALKLTWLLAALGIIGGLVVMNRLKVTKPVYYLLPGFLLWYVLHSSGVHATISGVILAFTMPLNGLARLETILHKPVNFVIMPLFALANTAIVLPADFSGALTSSISFGVIAGLVIGKPLGIFLFSWTAAKLNIAVMPSNTSNQQLLAIGMLGGIGFTMSIFTSSLSYSVPGLQAIAIVAVIIGSVLSAIAGFLYFRSLHTGKPAALEARMVKEETLQSVPLEAAMG